MHGIPSRRYMRGQALTELAVMAAVLVPLFLLIPMVAKYGHIKQMAQQAARNAAWEASVSKDYALLSQNQGERKALDRNFAAADTKIRSNVGSVSAHGEFGDQMLNTFSNRKLLERDNLQVPRMTQAESPGYMDEALIPIKAVTLGQFEMNKQGYVTANVKLNIRDLKLTDGSSARYLEPFDNLNLVLERKQTLLVDAWNASGPRSGGRSVIKTIKPLAPGTHLGALDKVLDLFKPLEFLPVIGAIGKIELGTVEPDIVPADKLAEYPVKK
jgi:hypothetical protein